MRCSDLWVISVREEDSCLPVFLISFSRLLLVCVCVCVVWLIGTLCWLKYGECMGWCWYRYQHLTCGHVDYTVCVYVLCVCVCVCVQRQYFTGRTPSAETTKLRCAAPQP